MNNVFSFELDKNLNIIASSVSNSTNVVSGDSSIQLIRMYCKNQDINYAAISFKRKDGKVLGSYAMDYNALGYFDFNILHDTRILALGGELKFSITLKKVDVFYKTPTVTHETEGNVSATINKQIYLEAIGFDSTFESERTTEFVRRENLPLPEFRWFLNDTIVDLSTYGISTDGEGEARLIVTTTRGDVAYTTEKVKATPELSIFVQKAIGDAEYITDAEAIVQQVSGEFESIHASITNETAERISDVNRLDGVLANQREMIYGNANAIDGLTNTKVSKTGMPNVVYGTNGSGGQTTYNVADNVANNSIAKRTASGKLEAAIPDLNDEQIYEVATVGNLLNLLRDSATFNIMNAQNIAVTNLEAQNGQFLRLSIDGEAIAKVMGTNDKSITNKAYVDAIIQAIYDYIPSAASVSNELADKAYVNSQIQAISGQHITDISFSYAASTGILTLAKQFENGTTSTITVDLPLELSFIDLELITITESNYAQYEKTSADVGSVFIRFKKANNTFTELINIDAITNSGGQTITDLINQFDGKKEEVDNAISHANSKISEMEAQMTAFDARETQWTTSESVRQANELNRDNAENNDSTILIGQSVPGGRVGAFNVMVTKFNQYAEVEELAVQREPVRHASEQEREANELERITAETERQQGYEEMRERINSVESTILDVANDAATKQYVDGALAGKVTKVSTPSSVYGTNSAGQQYQWGLSYSSATAWTIALRDAAGRIMVGTPVANNDAATKAYVDSLVGNIESLLQNI